MDKLITNPHLIDLITILFSFLAGWFVKWKNHVGSATNQAMESLSADYKAMKLMYDNKVDLLKQKDMQLITQAQDVMQLRSRIKTYEEIIQNRSPEVEAELKNLSHFMEEVRNALNIEAPHDVAVLEGTHHAISQAKVGSEE